MWHRRSPRASAGRLRWPGPAALAGIKPGDTVVKVGDTDVQDFDDMVAAVRKSDGSDALRRAAHRDGQQTEFTTTVDVTQTQR